MISIIIPTLNEVANLPETLETIWTQGVSAEVVVADAGSSDGTVALAESCGCRVVPCPKAGRAAQMNVGARAATGDIFLFLHADTHLSSGALGALRDAMEDQRIVGGGFSRRFRSPSTVLRFTSFLGSLRSRFFGLHFGDQAIFARRWAFEETGGFPDQPAFEDFEFSRQLRHLGPTVYLGPTTESSARRFAGRGALPVFFSDFWLSFRYLTGGDPQRLAEKAGGEGAGMKRVPGISATQPPV